MYDVREMQSEWYSKRIGARYGDFEVIRIEYDEKLKRQRWTMRCVYCGAIRTTINHKDYVKGKNAGRCKACGEAAKLRRKMEARAYRESLAERKIAEYESHIGETYGSWEIIGAKMGIGFNVRCTVCGKERWVGFSEAINHRSEKCTCENGKRKYFTEEWKGKRSGHLVIESYDTQTRSFICKCDCGNTAKVRPHQWLRGSHVTCGKECPYHQEDQKRWNGETKTRLYRIWSGMHRRCYNEDERAFFWYGARGITICDEWKDDFFAFRDWALSHGYRDDLTIDRIDSDGNYEPGNCRWSTYQEQARNKRPPYTFLKQEQSKIELQFIDGVGKTKKQWCEQYGITNSAVEYRMKTKGLTFEQALKAQKSMRGRPKKA